MRQAGERLTQGLTHRQLDVLSARVDPNRHEQPEERKTERGLLVEAHGGLLVGLEPGVPGCDATPLDDASSHRRSDRGSPDQEQTSGHISEGIRESD